MDNFNDILNKYASIVLTEELESIKCDYLYKSGLFDEYGDCWLLLSIILNSNYTLDNAPPFYFTNENGLEQKLLRVKFLVWLQILYRNEHGIDTNSMNPIELIRASGYQEFLKKFGEVFGSWKAEIFRGLFDFDRNKKEESLKIFQDKLLPLCDSEDISSEEKDVYKAFTSHFDEILNFLPEDPHNQMWAKLFISYIEDTNIPDDFSIQCVKDFTPIEFQKYCFKQDLITNLQESQIVDEEANTIDTDSLAFYFNLAIIFKNHKLASFLLPSYLSLLYKYKQYDSIFKYTYFLPSQLFTDEECRKYVSLTASSFEPDNLFLDPLRDKNREDEVKSLLLEIKWKIIKNDQNDYLKALNWLKQDDSVSKEFVHLAIECTYELVIDNIENMNEIEDMFSEARETYNMIKNKLPDLERSFWDSFLSESKDQSDDEKIKSSFKKLLLWAAFLKENDQVAFGYDDNYEDEEAFELSDRLIQRLFYFITNTYQKKLNNDVLNGKPI